MYKTLQDQHDLGHVWQGSGSAKPTLELLFQQFAAPLWNWTLNLELKRCVWQR
jgi:hypothetical protein